MLDNALTFMAYGEQQTGAAKSSVRGGVIAPRLDWRVETHGGPEADLIADKDAQATICIRIRCWLWILTREN